jgi:hypothetical protein
VHTRTHFLNQTHIHNVFKVWSNGTHLINDTIANHIGPFGRLAWCISFGLQDLKHHLTHHRKRLLSTFGILAPKKRMFTFIATFVTVSDNAGNSKCSESIVGEESCLTGFFQFSSELLSIPCSQRMNARVGFFEDM